MEYAKLETKLDRLEKALAELENTFVNYKDSLRDSIPVAAIRETAQSVKKDGREKLNADRLLRLGVVGQIKAGKSSLLNLLLFAGREVLPKAATPMTASLTHIVKSDSDEIEVVYYSKDDWAQIKRHDQRYQELEKEIGKLEEEVEEKQKPAPQSGPERRVMEETLSKKKREHQSSDVLKASHELVDMVNKCGIEVEKYLDKSDRQPVTVADMNGQLVSLVGADGDLTPLVKSVTIRCSQGIPDLDIVDTPGINDPIASRSREAQKLLSKCDAVLLLSYAGQFMDKTDAQFLLKRVREEGIKRRLLIGSKFDSVLVDTRKYDGNLESAIEGVEDSLRRHAMDAIARSRDADGALPDIKADDVQFVSAVCAGLATKPIPEWRDEERHYFDSLAKSYPDWLDSRDSGEISDETKAWLSEIGNAQAIQDKLRTIQDEKFSILAENLNEFLTQKRASMACDLGELADGLEQQREEVRNGQLKDMAKQKEATDTAIYDISEKVDECWNDLLSQRITCFEKLRKEVRSEAKKVRHDIKGAVETHTRHEMVENKGLFYRIKRLFVGGHETDTYEESYMNAVAIQYAFDNMIQDINGKVQYLRDRIFDRTLVKDASERINDIVANDLSNEMAAVIKPQVIRRSVRQAIERVARDGRSALKNESFSLQDDDVDFQQRPDDLVAGQKQAMKFVNEFVSRIIEGIERVEEKVDNVTEKAKKLLLSAATEQLQAYHKQLEEDIRNRDFSLERYKQVINAINTHRQELQGLEL